MKVLRYADWKRKGGKLYMDDSGEGLPRYYWSRGEFEYETPPMFGDWYWWKGGEDLKRAYPEDGMMYFHALVLATANSAYCAWGLGDDEDEVPSDAVPVYYVPRVEDVED